MKIILFYRSVIAQKWISTVNGTKFAGNSGFGHIYWKKSSQGFAFVNKSNENFLCVNPYRDHPLSTYAKFSEKLTFLTSWYVRVPLRGLEMLVFPKILRTYLMDDPIDRATSQVIFFFQVSLLSNMIIFSLYFLQCEISFRISNVPTTHCFFSIYELSCGCPLSVSPYSTSEKGGHHYGQTPWKVLCIL